MAIAGSLEVQLVADVARLRADMDKATGIVTAAAKAMESAATAATRALGGIAAGLSVAALAGQIRGAIEYADQLNKLSQRAGVTAEALSQLHFAAKLADVSQESLTTGIKKLNQSIAEGLGGDKAKAEAFKNMGIGLKDVTGKVLSADQVLLKIADRFSQASDGAVKTQYALALLGKAGDEMIPLLNGGGKAISDLMQKADRLGLTISTDFARRAEDFNDNLTILGASSKRLAVTMADDLVSSLGSVVKAMADASEHGGKLAGIIAGLNEFGNKFLDWEGNAQRKEISHLREQLDDAKKALGEITTVWSGLSSLQQRALPEIGQQVESATQKFLQLQNALRGAQQAYFHFSDAAGAGRGVAPDPRVLGPVGSIASQKQELKPLTGGAVDDSAARKALKELEDQKKLIAELSGLTGTFAEDWGRLNAMFARGALTLNQLTEAQAKLLKQQPFMKDQTKEQEEATKRLIDAEKDWADVMDGVAKALNDIEEKRAQQFNTAREMLENIEFETRALGMTNVEREKAIALRELERSGIDKNTDAYKEYAEKIKAAVESREGIREQIKVWESIDQTAHDAFTHIFENGRDTFTRLRDTLKATLLDLLYQMTVRKWIVQVGASIGMPGAAAAAQTLGGGMGDSGGLGGLGSLGGLAGGIGSLGGIGTAFTAGYSSVGVMAPGLLGLGGGGGLMGGAAAAMSAIPVAGWIGLAALAAYSIFGGKGGGPKTESGFGTGVPLRGDPSSSKIIADSIQQQYQAITGANAGSLDLGVFSATDPQGTAQTQLALNASLNGQGIYSRETRTGGIENVGRADGDLQAAVAEDATRALFAAVKATQGLSDAMKSILAPTDAYTSSLAEITATLARATAAEQQRKALQEQLFLLTHSQGEILQRQRETEVAALDDTNRELARRIYLVQDEMAKLEKANAEVDRTRGVLQQSYEQESGALQQSIDQHREYERILRAASAALLMGDALTGKQRRAVAASVMSQAGPEALPGAVNDYLGAVRDTARTGDEYRMAVAAARSALEAAASAQGGAAGIDQQQLDALKQQASQLGILNQNVVTFGDALMSYLAAIGEQTRANLQLGINKDFANQIPSFDVGTDYVPRDMLAMVHEGERITPRRYNQTGGDVSDELRQLRADMRASNAALLLKIGDLYKLNRDWDRNGLPATRVEA